MDQVDQKITSTHNWLARTAFIFFGIMLITFLGIVYVSNQKYETAPSANPTPIVYTDPSPTPDPTANWKTYINTKIGFEIKYPQAFEYQETNESFNFNSKLMSIPTIKFYTTDNKSKPSNFVTIRIFNAEGTNAELLTAKITEKYFVKRVSLWRDIAIGNFGGSSIETSDGTNNGLAVIGLPSEQLFYIHLTKREDTQITKDMFFTMLSTFKLLTNQITSQEKQQIDAWITKNNLNDYGDPKDTVYTGGTPLFNETTGQSKDKYEYILEKHPDRPWNK